MIQEGAHEHTLWGLTTTDLHARFWASRGVQVVCPGRASELVPHAELYLLASERTLALFPLAGILETMEWLAPTLYIARLHDTREQGYREHVDTDDDGRFLRFRRLYRGGERRVARVGFTTDVEFAKVWQNAKDAGVGWTALRRVVRPGDRFVATVNARLYDAADLDDADHFLRDLVRDWKRPDASIDRVRRAGNRVWADPSAVVDPHARVVGPLWIGAGRKVPQGVSAVGPSVMWDLPAARPQREEVRWMDLEPLSPPAVPLLPRRPRLSLMAKRAFDLFFASLAMLLTLPLYPIIMIAILLEDGRPWFFSHERETRGGRNFGCIKFRSMRKDAEQIKAQLQAVNQADGPQFFMENDPRLTRVGRFMRKYQIDEFPQFWNVIRGDMSIVGPRPSPHKENQFAPGWREARLSVRPGVTGLWQIRRTRAQGTDFQEWIRYDIEYVEKQSFWFDLVIIFRTVTMILKGFIRK